MPGRRSARRILSAAFLLFQGKSLAESFAGGEGLAAGGGPPHKRFDLNFIPADYGCRFRLRRFDSIPDRSGSSGDPRVSGRLRATRQPVPPPRRRLFSIFSSSSSVFGNLIDRGVFSIVGLRTNSGTT